MNYPCLKQILLVLDIDETLVHSRPEPLAKQAAQLRPCSYHTYKRPGLDDFLAYASKNFDLAFWSAAGGIYVKALLHEFRKSLLTEPLFVWSSEHCTRRFDPETQEEHFIKDFKKLHRRGFDLRRALIVEDSPDNCRRNYGNAVYIKPFQGDPGDRELYRLALYLESLKKEANMRVLEKRGWESAISLPELLT